MLFIVDQSSKVASAAPVCTFTELAVRERFDIQEWVLACPSLLGEELLIITSEFDRFDRTSERLDVLAVDRRGKLVIVELKRSAVGTKADLQALRYAAYCSTLGIDDIADLYAEYHTRKNGKELSASDAKAAITAFFNDGEFEEFDDQPRIILAAEAFPAEITATLLWLRSFDLDISAVKLQPYQLGGQLLVDSSVIIPLPEAEDFLISRERKEGIKQQGDRRRANAYRDWFQPLIDILREEHQFTNARVAQPQNWYSFASGFSRVGYAVAFTHNGLRVEVYVDPGDQDENKRVFDALERERSEIEREFGESLTWERLPDRRASRVGIYHGATIASSAEELDRARSWAIDRILRLRKTFDPRLARLLG